MRTALTVIIFTLAQLSAHAETTFYQCADQWDQPIFSDRPCGADAQLATVIEAQTTSGTPPSPSIWARISADNALREAERLITRREDRLKSYEKQRDGRITDLRYQGTTASNNLAGAQYRESLATEMQAVTSQYDAKIRSTRGDIDRLQHRIDRVRDTAAQLP
jgi:hypothetical protein